MAALPFGCELVLTCYVCEEPSSADVRGVDGWALERVRSKRLVDVCPRCQRRAANDTSTGASRSTTKSTGGPPRGFSR